MNLFSEQPSDRALYFILSTCILITFVPVTIGMYLIYPTDELLLRLLKSFLISLCLIILQFAALVWLWALTKADWTKRLYMRLRDKATLPMIMVPLLVLVFFTLGLK